ncbi:hypothetical protein T4C_13576, partial [Trichinella pseudospiralis]
LPTTTDQCLPKIGHWSSCCRSTAKATSLKRFRTSSPSWAALSDRVLSVCSHRRHSGPRLCAAETVVLQQLKFAVVQAEKKEKYRCLSYLDTADENRQWSPDPSLCKIDHRMRVWDCCTAASDASPNARRTYPYKSSKTAMRTIVHRWTCLNGTIDQG